MNKSVKSNPSQGGPKTLKGKSISSQNAIQHGLTAKQLLNPQELSRYENLVQDLAKHYGTPNPIIPIQIERIARLQIQLERIQIAIDGLYHRSNFEKPNKNQVDLSQIDSEVLQIRMRMILGLLDQSLLDKINNVLINAEIKSILSQIPDATEIENENQERPIISQASLLGAYLFAEARFYKADFKKYLDDKVKAISNTKNSKTLYESINLEILGLAIDIFNAPDLEEKIFTDDFYEFYLFKNWFEREIAKVPNQINAIKNLERQEKNQLNISMPNFDELDRLMRYQTTISRQLSTAIGELLVLVK